MFPTSKTSGAEAKGLVDESKGLVWSQRSGLRSKGLPLAGSLAFFLTKGLVKAGGQDQTFVATLAHGEEGKMRLTFPTGLLGLLKMMALGPYIKDVRRIFGILDPLPPLSAFWLDL